MEGGGNGAHAMAVGYKPVVLPWRTLNAHYPLGNSTSKSPLSKQADNSQLHEEIYQMISDRQMQKTIVCVIY